MGRPSKSKTPKLWEQLMTSWVLRIGIPFWTSFRSAASSLGAMYSFQNNVIPKTRTIYISCEISLAVVFGVSSAPFEPLFLQAAEPFEGIDDQAIHGFSCRTLIPDPLLRSPAALITFEVIICLCRFQPDCPSLDELEFLPAGHILVDLMIMNLFLPTIVVAPTCLD
jgi:hypothetical protein